MMNSTDFLKAHSNTAASGAADTSSSGNGAVSASLIQLEEMLSALVQSDDSPAAQTAKKKQEVSKEELLSTVADLLKVAFSKGKGSLTEVRQVVTLTANVVNEYTKTDPKATGVMTAILVTMMNEYLAKNPGKESEVLHAFSPLIAVSGKGMDEKLARATRAIENLKVAVAKEDPAVVEAKTNEVLGKILGGGSGAVLTTLLEPVKAKLNTLDPSADKAKYMYFAEGMYNILSLAALRNPGKAQEMADTLLKGDFMSSVYALDKNDMDSLLQSVAGVMKEMTNPNSTTGLANANQNLQDQLDKVKKHHKRHGGDTPEPGPGCGGDIVGNINGFLNQYQQNKQNSQNSANLSEILGLSMLMFQQFQQAVAQSQANQDQATMTIGTISVNAANDLQTQLDGEIKQEEAEQAKASEHHWWDFLIEAIVAIVAAIVTAVTAGIGAAIAGALVAGFMMSPLGSMVQDKLAELIAGGSEQDLYNKYISEGMSPQAAQEKAAAEWNKAMGFAGLVIVVATVIVTAGVGGIGTAAEEGASEAVDASVSDVASEVGQEAEQAAEETASSASKLSYSLSAGAKVGVMQGLMMLAGLDPMLNFLLSDPSIANNSKLVAGLAVAMELVTAAMIVAGGFACASEGTSGLAEKFASLVKPLIYANFVISVGSSAYNGAQEIQQAGYLEDAASFLNQIATSTQLETLYQGAIKMNQQTMNNINTNSEELIEAISDTMNTLEQDVAAQLGVSANQVLAG